MSLKETQTLLARLFTESALRRDFFATPEAVAARFDLTTQEAALFASIDRGEVDAFARSLLGKRVLDARKTTPLTALALGERFDRLLIDAIVTPADARDLGDCAALTRKLTRMASDGDLAPWIADIARFEYAFIEAAQPGLRLRRFRYDVGYLSRALQASAHIDATPRTTLGVWARLPGGRLRWRLFQF